MSSNDLVNQAVTSATSSGSGGGAGNAALSDAFDYAIGQAQQTLSITTKKGADLYALKQRPQ
jgi:hypothetical protein